VPASNRIGEEGDGMRVALGTLDFFRTSVGAAACGIAARGLEESRRRATSRKQFGSRLADFQLTQAALADMATELDAARLLVYRSAWLKDQGTERLTRESAMAKLFATEAAQRIVDRAVQIHGGAGVERGSVVERLYREVRALRIYEGTSEIQRLVIARQIIEETHGT
jgi:acyl-CoA dehydrogenase